MRLTIRTRVAMPYTDVFARFNRELFLALAPPFPPVTLKRFDGCKQGDIVHLELDMLAAKQDWISLIVEAGAQRDNTVFRDEMYFIDEGTTLPFFLRFWRHEHRIVSNEEGSTIVDAIEFRALWGLDLLLYPVLWLQFMYRKPIYMRFFGKVKSSGL